MTNNYRLFRAPLFLLCSTWTSIAAAAVSQADARAVIKSTISSNSKQAAVQLEIAEGLKFNLEGPWKLVLSGPIVERGRAREQFGRDDFNRQFGGFQIPIAWSGAAKELAGSSWTLTYFLCNAANTWCKRLTAQGVFTAP